MTNHYVKTLGVKKCREILKGVPETATNYCDDKYYEEWSYSGWVVSDGSQWIDCKKPKGDLILDDRQVDDLAIKRLPIQKNGKLIISVKKI